MALNLCGETRPENCLVVDDAVRNLLSASGLGFHTVLVGSTQTLPGIDRAIMSLKDLGLALLNGDGGVSSG